MKVDFTLLADGSSDRVLLPIIRWTFQRHVASNVPVRGGFPDLSRLRNPPKRMAEKMVAAVDLFPCDVLVVHRDAEGADPASRRSEIERAYRDAGINNCVLCIVPVRMTEAWLLFDEMALRQAAGNPNGQVGLELPKLGECETIANPKSVLEKALRTASELRGRRLKSFNWRNARSRLVDLVEDFAPLCHLSAFQQFDHDVGEIVAALPFSGAAGRNPAN